jgi:ATP-dependent DNA helicase RecQ
VVISPLLSLVEDQVMQLKAINVSADFLNSSQTADEIRMIMSELYAFARSNGQMPCPYSLLYVTPESEYILIHIRILAN